MKVQKVKDFQKAVYDIVSKYDGKRCNLMISGGSLLDVLNYPKYKDLNTEQWKIYYADERCNQNYLNSKGSQPFLSFLKSKVFPMRTELGKEKAVEDYNKALSKIQVKDLNVNNSNVTEANFIEMDVCLLGIGDNGHICSLWPDSESLNSKEKVIGVKVDCPFSPDRVTITIDYINNNVKELYFIIPPKNGVPKKVIEPHPSIKSKITKEYITILPE